MILSTSDFFFTLPCDTNCYILPLMTFTAPNGHRIRISFKEFIFDEPGEYFEFGDGLASTEERKLVRFYGTDPPSEVTSVSNEAWCKIAAPCGRNIPPLTMAITAIRSGGNYFIRT